MNMGLERGGISLMGLTLSLGGIACGIVYWTAGDVTESGVDFYTHTGLWSVCVEIKSLNQKTCDFDFNDFTDEVQRSFKAVRAMMILGCLFMGATCILGTVYSCKRDMRVLLLPAGGLAIAAGFFYMLAMAIYVEKLKQDALDYHAAFYLNIFAWLFAWICGGFFLAGNFMNKTEKE